MSLSLLQGYSSAEEDQTASQSDFSSSSDDDDAHHRNVSRLPSSDPAAKSSNGESQLPSAFEAFSQISAPPQFLNNSAEQQSSIDVRDSVAFRGRRKSKDKKDFPPGAVLEAKPQLVGIHERVRNDIEGNVPPSSANDTKKASSATLAEGGKRVSTASNPDAKDASDLLRMCLQCGVPKTYSNAHGGMVCPECGDRPPSDESLKKKGSTVKDKEKIKRMRGQSTHASWKSETEMHLRQQFD